MLKVSHAVREVIFQDDIALLALESGILNFSAYAEQILPSIIQMTLKPVKKGTVIVALTRMVDECKNSAPIRPKIILDDLSIRSPLCDVTFHKTVETRNKLRDMYTKISPSENAFFTVTQSMSEITIIAPQSTMNALLKHFKVKPKAVYSNLAGISVRFSEEYLPVPNILYTLQAALAVHQINFIEIVSTYTEFSYIIEKKYLETATQALKQFFK